MVVLASGLAELTRPENHSAVVLWIVNCFLMKYLAKVEHQITNQSKQKVVMWKKLKNGSFEVNWKMAELRLIEQLFLSLHTMLPLDLFEQPFIFFSLPSWNLLLSTLYKATETSLTRSGRGKWAERKGKKALGEIELMWGFVVSIKWNVCCEGKGFVRERESEREK